MAVLLGIDVKKCHNYSTGLQQLLDPSFSLENFRKWKGRERRECKARQEEAERKSHPSVRSKPKAHKNWGGVGWCHEKTIEERMDP